MSKCRYCNFWKNSVKREQGDPTTRFCERKQKMVNKEDEICGYSIDGFEMSDFFWCDSRMCYKPCLGCIKNQDLNLDDECKFCTQGEEVSMVYECSVEPLKRRKLKLLRRK